MKTKNDALLPLIAELDDVIAAARAAGLGETTSLLRIARLDLMMRAHGIAADELELVSFALVSGYCQQATEAHATRKPKRPKKPGPG